MKTCWLRLSFTAVFCLFLPSLLLSVRDAQATDDCAIKRTDPKPPNEKSRPKNGIDVGCPQIFDNRTLTLMLESLNGSLKNVQVIDQKTLAAALGTLQGSHSHDVTSNLSVTTTPTPATSNQTVLNTGIVDANGNPLPNTAQTTNGTTVASITPQAPTLDAAQTSSDFTPNYGVASQDLLMDQANLTYQIFGLRLMLDRSLSSRLKSGGTRLQTVFGVNVSIDTPRTANDAVAIVEMTVHTHDVSNAVAGGIVTTTVGSRNAGPGLVSILPQENAYNAAALNTSSHAFGGSAVIKLIQVGYSQRRSGKTFYLYRDIDMIAYQRVEPDDPTAIVFGWMFRPVLGQASISVKDRQLFAVLSMPTKDAEDTNAPDAPVQFADATVKTYWKRYDKNTLTSFLPNDENRAKRFKYALSMGLANPQIFESRYTSSVDYSGIPIFATSSFERALRPSIVDVDWRLSGSKSVLISASGKNFFTGTQVVMGDKAYATPTDGLLLKSDNSFDLSTTLDSFAFGGAAVVGRYGRAIPLEAASPNGTQFTGGVKLVGSPTLDPNLGGFRTLTVTLEPRPGGPAVPFTRDQLPQSSTGGIASPVITFNGHVVPPPYDIENAAIANQVVLRASVDNSLVGDGGVVKVFWPFLPADRWTSTYHVYNPGSVFTLTKMADKTLVIASASPGGFILNPVDGTTTGAVFCWSLLAGDTVTQLKTTRCPAAPGTAAPSPNLIEVTLKDAVPKKVVLVSPYQAAFPLDVPDSPDDKKSDTQMISLKQFESEWVNVTGKDLSTTKTAELNGIQLDFRFPPPAKDAKPGDPVKTIQVHFTTAVTSTPSDRMDLTIADKNGKQLATAQVSIICVSKCTSGGK
jgi:hypothetical protein